MQLDLDTIRELVTLATENQLAELSVEHDHQKVSIKTTLSNVHTAHFIPPPISNTPEAFTGQTSSPILNVPENNYYQVTSPMVGTFYRAPSPDAAVFAEVGSSVSVGQTVCIIEAMKLMNELECEVSGTVKKVFVENGKPVEFGQVLMEIEVA